MAADPRDQSTRIASIIKALKRRILQRTKKISTDQVDVGFNSLKLEKIQLKPKLIMQERHSKLLAPSSYAR
ncbi:MAG: hypothetical protein ACFFAZ_16715, partial [Promethearchaeota archaeon]